MRENRPVRGAHERRWGKDYDPPKSHFLATPLALHQQILRVKALKWWFGVGGGRRIFRRGASSLTPLYATQPPRSSKLSLGPSSPPPPATILPHPYNTLKEPNFKSLHPEGDDTYLLQSTLVPDPTPGDGAGLKEHQTCSVCVHEPPNPSSCPRPKMLRPPRWTGHGLCFQRIPFLLFPPLLGLPGCS